MRIVMLKVLQDQLLVIHSDETVVMFTCLNPGLATVLQTIENMVATLASCVRQEQPPLREESVWNQGIDTDQ